MLLVLKTRALGNGCNTRSDQAIYGENAITHRNSVAFFLRIYPKRIDKYVYNGLSLEYTKLFS